MFESELFRVPRSGFGGIRFGVMPPFARGIYGGIVGVLVNLSANGAGGLCRRSEGILLVLFGLF